MLIRAPRNENWEGNYWSAGKEMTSVQRLSAVDRNQKGASMKRLLAAAALVGLSSQILAQSHGRIHLVCTGWTPGYRTFDRGAENPAQGNENDSMVMELDKVARTIKLTTQIGPTTFPLEENDQFYWSTVQINRPVLDKIVSHLSISINRMTGAGHVSYQFAGETNGKVAFTGKCAPGKAMF